MIQKTGGFVVRALFLVGLCLFLQGCGQGRSTEGKVVATVNGEPIYVSDFNRTLALTYARNPMFKITPQTIENLVDMLIDRKLLIQQARARNLDRTSKFVATIQTFWEQTLIRDLIVTKDRDIESSVSVSDKEVEDYYGNLCYRKTFHVARVDGKAEAAELIKKGSENIAWQETLGPLAYDDLSPILKKAFNFPVGVIRHIESDGKDYIVEVADVKKVKVAAIDKVKKQIISQISAEKRKQLFDKWLKNVRVGSAVDINNNTLKTLESKND